LRAKSIIAVMAMAIALFTGVNSSVAGAAVDNAFATSGRFPTAAATAAATTPAGKIRVVNLELAPDTVRVFELNPDGTPNAAWGTAGSVTIAVPPPAAPGDTVAGPSVVEVAPSGAMYAQFEQGGSALVMKLTPAGAPDATFGGDGFARAAAACGVPVDGGLTPTGGFLSVANGCNLGTTVVHFDGSGTETGSGTILNFYASSGVTAADGSIYLAGGTGNNEAAVAHLSAALTVDAAFGTAGVATFEPDPNPLENYNVFGIIQFPQGYHSKLAADIAMDSTGRPVVVVPTTGPGLNGDVAVIRLTPAGVLDVTFGSNGVAVSDLGANADDWPLAVRVDANDRPLVAGSQGSAPAVQNQFLTRFTTAGALDTTFDGDGVSIGSFGETHIPEHMALTPNAVYLSGTRLGAGGGFVAKDLMDVGAVGVPWPVAGCNYASAPYAATGFTDVAAGLFYSEPVAWAKASNITTGTTATTYSPDAVVTRAQMAAFLHRMVCNHAGAPAAGFADVPAGQFYSAAVDWLKANSVTTGTTATTYSPGDVVNRAQMAAFLHRMAGSPTGSPASGFADVPAGQFYTEGVNWLKAQNITTGTTATTYAPTAVVTRAEMATFLFRMGTM